MFGWGWRGGFGRGWGRGFGWFGWGRGWGNPFPFCRNFPWLPRWWWATPQAPYYAQSIANFWANMWGYPGWGAPVNPPQDRQK